MKILHQVGHNKKWNIDAHFINEIGDGFIFGAFNFTHEQILKLKPKILEKSSIDLQFYGKGPSDLGKFNSYPFHPANRSSKDKTVTDGLRNIIEAITYQQNLGISKVIIPNYYFENDLDSLIKVVISVNKYLQKFKDKNFEYYLTMPLSNQLIRSTETLESLLTILTKMDMVYDGYYVVCESKPGYKRKISVDPDYFENLSMFFNILNSNNIPVIYGYANWDAIIFLTLTEIDYITIGTYENLRNFNYLRYSEKMQGGPSDGWYFSEKLLNFIRAREITKIRRSGSLNLVSNDNNIFSEIILDPDFIWNTHKAEVHKNYLLSISQIMIELSNIKDINERISYMIERIQNAKRIYEELVNRKVFLVDESSDYFLSDWEAFLKSKL